LAYLSVPEKGYFLLVVVIFSSIGLRQKPGFLQKSSLAAFNIDKKPGFFGI